MSTNRGLDWSTDPYIELLSLRMCFLAGLVLGWKSGWNSLSHAHRNIHAHIAETVRPVKPVRRCRELKAVQRNVYDALSDSSHPTGMLSGMQCVSFLVAGAIEARLFSNHNEIGRYS